MIAAAHPAKERPVFDTRGSHPRPQRAHRAGSGAARYRDLTTLGLLIGLAVRDRYDEALIDLGNMIDSERGKL